MKSPQHGRLGDYHSDNTFNEILITLTDMRKELSAPIIISAVCNVCGITAEELESKNRHRKITDARKMAAFLLIDSRVCTRMAEVSPLVGLCRNSGYKTLESFEELVRFDPSFRERFQRACLILDNAKTA